MLKLLIAVAALALAGCVSIDRQPPPYGCEGLEEFGCPTQPTLA
jgi:hypothetical protein